VSTGNEAENDVEVVKKQIMLSPFQQNLFHSIQPTTKLTIGESSERLHDEME